MPYTDLQRVEIIFGVLSSEKCVTPALRGDFIVEKPVESALDLRVGESPQGLY
jgi:hypothetical protein